MFNKILNFLHKDDQKSLYYRAITNAVAVFFEKINVFISKIRNNFFFDSLDVDGAEYFENLLKMEPPEKEIEYIDGVEYNVCHVKMTDEEIVHDNVNYPVGLISSDIKDTPLIVLDGINHNEALIKFEIGASLDERRNKIQAKWLSGIHNDIDLIQKVIDAWKPNEAVADFVDGLIDITFYGYYGLPDYFEELWKLIDDVKPAHLGVRYNFKYLLIEDIHEVKTIDEMNDITINRFMSGIDE